MEFQLPTFEQALELVRTNDAFIHKIEEVDGFKAHIFNYRLANYTDFQAEGALEMRGLTFIECPDDSVSPKQYERFIHLHKFFNHGEQAGEEGIQSSPIKSVQTKEDGSMIVPILIGPEIYCKTRGTFHSEQAQIANKMVIENEQLEKFIRWCYDIDCIPVFEFVSPFNQIVLLYDKPELRLLQVRNRKTGEYQDLNGFAADIGVKIRESWASGDDSMFEKMMSKVNGWWTNRDPNMTDLEKILSASSLVTEKEGWVVQFENGHMVKIKTAWYSALHHLLTENLTRENEIISWVLNETLDDVLGQVPDTDMRKDYALDIAKFLRGQIAEWVDEIDGIMTDPKRKTLRKDFAIKHNKHQFFGVLMRLFTLHEDGKFEQDSIFDFLKESLLKRTHKWGEAQDFLRKLGFTSNHLPQTKEE